MTNNWGHRYPNNIGKLLDRAIDIASILNQPDQNSLRILSDFYFIQGQRLFKKNEFLEAFRLKSLKGIYCFYDHNEQGTLVPIYIGITRDFNRRLRQHAWGEKPNECSLAYLMAKDTFNLIDAKENLETYKSKIQNYKVNCIEESDDFDLYFLEVAIAGILKTKWNSFRTH